MKVLVTGANGYLCSFLIPGLESVESYEVFRATRKNFSSDLIEHFQPDIVINTVNAYCEYSKKNADIYESNLLFGTRLLQYLESTNKEVSVINCSTALPKNYNIYAFSKRQFEEFARNFRPRNINFINLRMQSFYGANLHENLISYVIERCRLDETVLLSAGGQEREYTYIDDVIDAIIAVTRQSASLKEYLNIDVGSGSSFSVQHVARTIKEIMGSKSDLQFGQVFTPQIAVPRSNLKILKSLGWREKYTLKTGLKKTIGDF